jgi:hypothetical protein
MERQYINLALSAFIAFGGLIMVLILARLDFHGDVMMAVFFAGSVGAVVNNYFRLASLSANPEAIKDLINRPAVTIQMYVSLFVSGILGFVAYGLFLSGLLQGELFPEFESIHDNYQSLSTLLESVSPKTNLDTAKAIMWAFVAGFSERLIPNILDSLIVKVQKERG